MCFNIIATFFFSAILRRRPSFFVMDGADLDPNDELFQGALLFLQESAFDTDEAYDTIQSQEVGSAIYNYVNLANAHERLEHLGSSKFEIYPKAAFDLAEQWVGEPTLPLDEEYCRKRAENATPCHVTLIDPRIMNPKTVSLKAIIFN